MSQEVHYLETGSQNPFYNLAFEETVLRNRREGEYLLLWQNDNTIVIGQNQNAEGEINRAFVEAHDIRVVRRTTGGGAVYHDLGNLNYSFITDAGDAERLTMERFTRPIVEALKGLGLQAEASGRNDILVEGRKVSGTAQRLLHGRILHHGTLLFDSNPGMVAGALNADPAKFQSKSAKSVRSGCFFPVRNEHGPLHSRRGSPLASASACSSLEPTSARRTKLCRPLSSLCRASDEAEPSPFKSPSSPELIRVPLCRAPKPREPRPGAELSAMGQVPALTQSSLRSQALPSSPATVQ